MYYHVGSYNKQTLHFARTHVEKQILCLTYLQSRLKTVIQFFKRTKVGNNYWRKQTETMEFDIIRLENNISDLVKVSNRLTKFLWDLFEFNEFIEVDDEGYHSN